MSTITVDNLLTHNLVMTGTLNVAGNTNIDGYFQTYSIVTINGDLTANAPTLCRGNVYAGGFIILDDAYFSRNISTTIINEFTVDNGVHIGPQMLFKDNIFKLYRFSAIFSNPINCFGTFGKVRISYDLPKTSCAIGQPCPNLSTITGTNNIALFAKNAFENATTCSFNVAIGNRSLQNITTGTKNVAIGVDALKNITTQSNNIAIGSGSLQASNASNSISIGTNANPQSSVGTNSFCIGNYSSTGTGNDSIIIGHNSSNAIASGDNNIFIGYNVCPELTTGGSNIVVGKGAGLGMTNSNNIVLGKDATAATFSNCIVLGREAAPDGDGQIVLGSATYPLNILNTTPIITAGTVVLTNPDFYTIERINGVNYKFPRFLEL